MVRVAAVALVLMAGSAQTTVSHSAPTSDRGEPEIPAASTARFPEVSEREGRSAELVPTEDSSVYRYGSGLEDNAAGAASDPLLQSGLEHSSLHQAARARVAVLQYGSGLDDDGPASAPNILLESGLDERPPSQAVPARSTVLRYGSGLEDDAPVRAPNTLLESGLDDEVPVLNLLPRPRF